jgi:hypothetical protein
MSQENVETRAGRDAGLDWRDAPAARGWRGTERLVDTDDGSDS